MTAPKRVRILRPQLETDGYIPRNTGNVSVDVVLTWLKSEPLAHASLTPWEAVELAERLLSAASAANLRRPVTK